MQFLDDAIRSFPENANVATSIKQKLEKKVHQVGRTLHKPTPSVQEKPILPSDLNVAALKFKFAPPPLHLSFSPHLQLG